MRLIDADALPVCKEHCIDECGFGANFYVVHKTDIDAAPTITIEAEPVKHGRWVEVNEHMWRKDEDGEIDEWAWDSDFHNGPVCELCHSTPCIHCKPDWENSKCYVTSYRCSECNDHEKEATSYCPNCGCKMDLEET